MVDAVDKCAEKAGMDAAALHECAEGEQGDELERAAAEETAGLCPPHAYVPWCARGMGGMGSARCRHVPCAASSGHTRDAAAAPQPQPSRACKLSPAF